MTGNILKKLKKVRGLKTKNLKQSKPKLKLNIIKYRRNSTKIIRIILLYRDIPRKLLIKTSIKVLKNLS